MATPITWRNIGQLSNADSNRLFRDSVSIVNRGLTSAQDAVGQLQQRQQQIENKPLEAALAQIEGLSSTDDVRAALDGNFLNQLNLTDKQRVQAANALQSQLGDVNQREGIFREQSARERSALDRNIENEFNTALAQGNFEEAQRIAGGHSQSGNLIRQAVDANKARTASDNKANFDANVLNLLIEARSTGDTAGYNAASQKILVDALGNRSVGLQDALAASQLISGAASTDPNLVRQRADAQTQADLQRQLGAIDIAAQERLRPTVDEALIRDAGTASQAVDRVIQPLTNETNLNPFAGSSYEEAKKGITDKILNPVTKKLRKEIPGFKDIPGWVMENALKDTAGISGNTGLGTVGDGINDKIAKDAEANIRYYLNLYNENRENINALTELRKQQAQIDAANQLLLRR